MKRKILFFILLLFFNFNYLYAENVQNITYSSNIWLSKDNFFEGEKIRIYSEFENKETYDIEQIIQFFDNQSIIDEKKIAIASRQKIIIWTDADLKSGEHRIIAKVKESYKDDLGKKEKILLNSIANLKIIGIDKDTDNDGIGNKIDTDDDNDGYSDEEEIKNGSDPNSKLSTPKTESIKNKTEIVVAKSKNIISELLTILNEKRESLQKQLDSGLKKEDSHQVEKKTIYKKEEKKLIEEQKKIKDFEKIKNNKKNIFKNISTPEAVIKKANTEIDKIEKEKINEAKKDFSKACLLEAKYEKLNELKGISDEENKKNWLSKLWYYIIFTLSFIFKSSFLTTMFFILIFWILWKIIKKI